MKATRPSHLRALLAGVNARPSRRLGQNFLIDENIARMALDAAGVTSGDRVLEIGPGAGALTEGLLGRGVRVFAVEKDQRLVELLESRWAGEPCLEICCADALDLGPEVLLDRGAIRTVVSNLPYSSGTRILVALVTAACPPVRIVATLQTEVVDRIAAAPGCAEYGLLSIWIQRLYRLEILHKVSPTCFYPVPEVDSTLFRLQLREGPLAEVANAAHFMAFTRWAFQFRRKQMSRILGRLPPELGALDSVPGLWLERRGIQPAFRPGDLSVETWVSLSNTLVRLDSGPCAVSAGRAVPGQ
jgi:16S rRNA (adenine1518-N6/adenine1519-N6)-dimethyltransferase